nr:hypothetical protein [Tanacetum cinerariifolium]
MESLSPQVVSAAKLPILNPNEFDLWKMRIEQYFLMTDYSLRENKLKARGTLLMALPNKHQLKFNIHKDAKTLMEAIKKRFGGNKETKKVHKTLLKQQYKNFTDLSSESLIQIHDRLQKLIKQLEILGESLSQEDINLKFLKSLPTEWRTHTLIWRNKTDLEEQSLDDLFNSLKIYEAERTGRNLGGNGPNSMGFDMSKVKCYNCHRKRHFARECRSPKDTRRNGAAEPQRRNVPVETSTLNALVSQCDSMFTSETDDSLPASLIYDRPSIPIIKDWVSDSEDDSEDEIPPNTPSFVQPTAQVKTPRPSVKTLETFIPAANHKTVIPMPKSNGNHRNRKACFVCKSLDHFIKDYDFYEKKMAQTPVRNHAQRGNHQQYAIMTLLNPQRHLVPTAVLTKSKLVPITVARPVTAAFLKPLMTRPRQAKTAITKPHSPPRRTINHSPSLKLGNPQHALKDKGVIDSGCSWNMIGNMSYLSDFEELNGGCVAFGGNPKGGKISRKDV